ncbi:MAG: family 43 glycosylhydrolase, partial [Blautia sp.]|nr:family 43 glycosylhydrolase [Blautia sp.]
LAEMISPTEVMDEKIMLSMPEYDFELHGNPLINEGPSVIIRGDTVNLAYSASGSWTDEYCLGLLIMDRSKDPKDPESWKKETSPILEQDYDLYGPGHNCFVPASGGSPDLIIYHAARWMKGGWNRSVRFGFVDFNERGKLQQITGVCGEELIELPEDEEAVTVIPADEFVVSEDMEIRGNQGERYAEGFLGREDTAAFTVHSETERDAYVLVMVRGRDLFPGILSGLEISANGRSISVPVYSSEDYAPAGGWMHLLEGENLVTVRTDIGGSMLEIQRAETR